MPQNMLKALLLSAILLLSAAASLAADKKAEAPGATADQAKPSEKAVKGNPAPVPAQKPAVPAVPRKLIDINSAKSVELQQLPGISAALADKIIAGRPYLTKSHLVTKKVLPIELFQSITKQIVATQPAK